MFNFFQNLLKIISWYFQNFWKFLQRSSDIFFQNYFELSVLWFLLIFLKKFRVFPTISGKFFQNLSWKFYKISVNMFRELVRNVFHIPPKFFKGPLSYIQSYRNFKKPFLRFPRHNFSTVCLKLINYL